MSEIKTKVMRIMELALEISPPTVKCNIDRGLPAVHVEYHPHCSSLMVGIHSHGWGKDLYYDTFFYVFTDSDSDLRKLDNAIEYLENLYGTVKEYL